MAKILIIEDNPWNIGVATLLLQRAGHEVLECGDATSGLAVAQSDQPDLILMDLNLPGVDGLTAVRLLKENDKTRRIKVYAYTAVFTDLDDQSYTTKILSSGCDGIIQKNVSPQDFIAAVQEAIRR